MVQPRRAVILRMTEPFDDIFDHHDRAVDQHADGDGEAAQAHEVGRQAHAAHHQEGY